MPALRREVSSYRNTDIMKSKRDILIAWLRDAHAMESNVVAMLEKQADKLEDHPVLQRRIADHAEESKRHAEKVETCLKGLDSGTSTFKEGVAKLTGMATPGVVNMASDDAVKCVLGNTATEHFEIACYKSLRAAAVDCGETSIARMAQAILEEEEAMARFLEDHIDEVTVAHLAHEAAPAGLR